MSLRVDDISKLPSQLADQVNRKLEAASAKKLAIERKNQSKQKFNAQTTEVDGVKFDSKIEKRRYDELMLLLRAGVISELKLHEEFTLIEAYTLPNGERVRRMKYTCDFSYVRDGKKIVEDVKSKPTKTRDYMIRKKMMLDKYGITVSEVMY